ncbi:uncharacterized protein LOC132642179 [Lycium barbarum]|uniref:uncharacterized protein LOC132642179 n=1 Tax=Lycium barbarum TaxID=112863 RepID=UPI00293ED062|nr:uncharacterized protein LOC132642179 [Lycium barbarum]
MDKPRGGNARRWLEEDELILLDILHKGKHVSKSDIILAQAWRDIIHEFWARTSDRKRYDEQCIKRQYHRLKKNWADFKELLSPCLGYERDQETDKIVAPTDVWANHVARFSDYKRCEYHGLKHFDKLDEMFGQKEEHNNDDLPMSRHGKNIATSYTPYSAKILDHVKQYLQRKREHKESLPLPELLDSFYSEKVVVTQVK